MSSNKKLAELFAAAKAESPLKDLNTQQAALRVNNYHKRGVPTHKPTAGSFRKGQKPWNTGMNTGANHWGQTRRARGAEKSGAERRAYFGGVQQHTEKTLRQMSKSAQARWARTQRSVWCEGVQYLNIYAAAETLQCHPTTILYRIRTRPKEYHWVERSDSTEGAHG